MILSRGQNKWILQSSSKLWWEGTGASVKGPSLTFELPVYDVVLTPPNSAPGGLGWGTGPPIHQQAGIRWPSYGGSRSLQWGVAVFPAPDLSGWVQEQGSLPWRHGRQAASVQTPASTLSRTALFSGQHSLLRICSLWPSPIFKCLWWESKFHSILGDTLSFILCHCRSPSASYSLAEVLTTREIILEYELDHVTSLLRTFQWCLIHSWIKFQSPYKGLQDYTWSGPWFCLCSLFLPASAPSLCTSLVPTSQTCHASTKSRTFATIAPSAWTSCGLAFASLFQVADVSSSQTPFLSAL